MGLSDFFKPGWKKDASRAVESIQKSSDLMTIVKIHDECGFKGKDFAMIDGAFVDRLQRLAEKKPEAAEYLEYLAREGDSVLLRCRAAWALIDRPGMRDIIKENIIKAYADPDIKYIEKPEEWITCIDDPKMILNLFSYKFGENDLKQRVLSRIKDQNLLMEMILTTGDETLAVDLMGCLDENEDNYIKIAEKCRYIRCVRCAVQHIGRQDVLYKIILDSKDEETASTAIKRFEGTEEDYKTILLKSPFKYCRQVAARKMGGVTPELIAAVKDVKPLLAAELFDFANESELIVLADMGMKRAIEKLTEKDPKKYFEKYEPLLPDGSKRKIVSFLAMQNPDKYGEKYFDLLSEEAKKKVAETRPYIELKNSPERYIYYLPDSTKRDMIDSGSLSQEVLEKLAMETYVRDANDSKNIAVKAYRKLTNMDRQARLLFDKNPSTFNGPGPLRDWRMRIIHDLSFNEEIMWNVFRDDKFSFELKKEAFKHITDPEKLEQIAAGNSSFAAQAAEKLPKNRLSKLRNSDNPAVANLGMAQYNRNRVSRVDEEELLEIMKWEYANSSDPSVYLIALDRLENQDALCKVMSDYLGSSKHWGITKEDRPWAPVGEKILRKITDGAGLANVCLEKCRLVEEPVIQKLKKLIQGTDEEKKFTESAAGMLMTLPMENWWDPAGLLAKYYDLPGAAHAAWQFGGPSFIQKVLNQLDAARESGRAAELGSILKVIYQQVPESHMMLSKQNGRRYVKHYDYVDEGCAGNNESRRDDYVLELGN